MAQKTLIIGLGSTGLSIARDVLERVRDEFGTTERIPWIEAACFETARVADDDLLKGRMGDLGISATQYETIVGNLAQYSEMDALSWTDQRALQSKDLAQGTTDGAGNVRMIGRLCWLFGKNLTKFESLVLDKLAILKGLNDVKASNALGSWPYRDGPPGVTFTKEPNDNEDRIAIYVCGTLTGGTCSGAFIDVGYYLSKLPATRGCTRIGLFTIPNQGHTEGVRMANAYAALRELNHFHSAGSVYRAKLATLGSVESITATPYKSIFLCQPPSMELDAVDDVIRSFGQYIYLQAISPVGDNTLKELVNPNAARSGASDIYGNPMNFNSLGVSVIEFPAEHVVKGCTTLLASRAVAQWIGQIEMDGTTAIQLIRGKLRIETSIISADILTPQSGSAPYYDVIRSEIDRAVGAAHAGAIDVMAEVQGSLDGAFDAKYPGPTGKGLERGTLEIQAKTNGDTVYKERVAEIQRFLHDSMKEADRGPNYCLGLIKAIKSYAGEQRAALRQEMDTLQQRLASAQSSLAESRERIEDCHSAGVLKTPGYKRTALNICCSEYEEAMTSYYFAKLDALTIDPRYKIYDQLFRMSSKYEERLSHSVYGILNWAERLKNQLHANYERLVDTPPRVNGKLFYDPSTIPNNYKEIITEAKPGEGSIFSGSETGEAYAKRQVISDWEWIADEFTKAEHSFFDTPKADEEKDVERPIFASQFKEVMSGSRGYFLSVLRSDVCKMLTEVDYATEIRTALGKSSELLAVTDSPRNKAVNGNLHKPRLAFFAGAASAAPDSPAGKVKEELQGIVPTNNQGTLMAPYRMVFVSARATFSLSTIEGLRPEAGPEGDSMRRAYVRLQAEDNRSYQTRVDVRWKSLETAFPFAGFQHLKAQILGGLATNQMQVSGSQGLTLLYDLYAEGDRLGRLPLGKDLDEATYAVHDDPRVEGAFKLAMVQQEKSEEEYGPKLRNLTKVIATYQLTDKGMPVDERRCRELLRNYVLTVPKLSVNYDENLVAPTKESFLRPAVPENPQHPEIAARPEAYYCDCGVFIMDKGSNEPWPEFCKCGNRLSFSGI